MLRTGNSLADCHEITRITLHVQLWPWEDSSLDELELAYRRMRAMFEFLEKLGVDYWCFHDRWPDRMATSNATPAIGLILGPPRLILIIASNL